MARKNLAMRILPLFLGAALAGCSTVGADKLKPGLTLAPVSVMGDALTLRNVGGDAFHDYRTDIDVAHWRIDRHAESVAGRVVGENGKFRIAQADTEQLRKTVRREESLWTGGPRIEAASGPLTAFAKQSAADYVLLIGPASMGDPFMGTHEPLSGYGIYQRSFRVYQPAFAGVKRAVSFLTMKVTLLDGRSGAAVAHTQCALSAPRAQTQTSRNIQPDEGTRAEIEKLFEGTLRKCLAGLKLS